MPRKRLETLICCCCGRYTKGRQWWNRDTGYGLCDDCIESNGVQDVPMGQETGGFGIRGFHWDVSKEPVLRAGVIYAADNGRLICRDCAGQSALWTGHDISGQPVMEMPATPGLACERKCTSYE